MIVCHLIPRLPPAIDGIGGYGAVVAGELERNHGVENRFVVGDPVWRGDGSLPWKAETVAERSAEALAAALERAGRADVVLLHYVGYGYDGEGLPFWLVKGVEEAARARGVKWVVLFHELWATGPFWKKTFYTIGAQKGLVRRLLRVAERSFTTTCGYHRFLRRETPDLADPIPVFGLPPEELPSVTAEEGKGLKPLIFGLPGTRLSALKAHRARLKKWAEVGKIDRLLLVGKAAAGRDADEERRWLEKAGLIGKAEFHRDVPTEELGRFFVRASLSLSGYPARLICKSTTLLAAMAHGCPVFSSDDREPEPLVSGRDFVSEGEAEADPARLRAIGLAGREWVRQHATPAVVAARIYEVLRSV